MSKRKIVALVVVLGLLLTASCAPSGTEIPDSTSIPELLATVTSDPTNTPRPTATLSASSAIISVDSCGANPFDDMPDSQAIQTCLNQVSSGDTVVFTSPGGDLGYRGYIIDQTIILVNPDPKADLIFTSTNPEDHALLIASPDLLGYVAQLYSRSIMVEPSAVDNITVEGLDFDGNRDARRCYGADERMDGADDNWGSWLADECRVTGDAWCSPGTLAMRGFFGKDSSSGIVVRDVTISNTECGSALAYNSIYGVVDSVVIDTAGDHVHVPGCSLTDPDEPSGAWSDGITFAAFESILTNNTVINASDIGIVCFACANTIISNNTILAEPGNYGMFAGIALHPYWNGDMSGTVISGNQVTNLADTTCGGIHVGIDIGAHMWSAGCENHPSPMAIGNIGSCAVPSSPPGGVYCDPGQPCRIWGYVPEGESFTLTENLVTGSQVNFLIGGMEFAGELNLSGNVSKGPQMTDWQSDSGCTYFGLTDSWGIIEFVAHDPSLSGWTDQRIYCAR